MQHINLNKIYTILILLVLEKCKIYHLNPSDQEGKRDNMKVHFYVLFIIIVIIIILLLLLLLFPWSCWSCLICIHVTAWKLPSLFMLRFDSFLYCLSSYQYLWFELLSSEDTDPVICFHNNICYIIWIWFIWCDQFCLICCYRQKMALVYLKKF